MTATEVFRIANLILSLGATIYLLVVIKTNPKIRNLCIFPLTVTLDFLIKSIAILFYLPLTMERVVFFNNWAFIANIHAMIMIICMVYYFNSRTKKWKV